MDYKKIIERLKLNGFDAYIVGGSVRDVLLNRPINDYDIVTSAKYDEIREVFNDRKLDEVGKNFQVMIIDGYEVASYRKDVYDANGNMLWADPVSSIEEDLGRRDLTINSMAMDIDTGELIDPFNGKEDIDRKIIRFTGDPNLRIVEDHLRMMRACRFLSTLDRFRFDENSFNAICRNAKFIKNIPPERIKDEMIKAMKNAKYAGNFFRGLYNTGLLSNIVPEMMPMIGHDGGRWHRETVWEHTLMVTDCIEIKSPYLKLAAMFHDIGKPKAYQLNCAGTFTGHEKYGVEIAEPIFKHLRFSNSEIHYMLSVIKLHMSNIDMFSTSKVIRKFLVKCEELNVPIEDMIAHKIADHNGNLFHEPHPPGMFDSLMLKINRVIEQQKPAFSIKDLVINGNDIMRHFDLNPGPQIGKILTYLFACVINNPEYNTRECLFTLAHEYLE